MADRRLADLIREIDARLDEQESCRSAGAELDPPASGRTLSDAVDRFLLQHGSIGGDGVYRGDSAHGTWRKYRSSLRFLISFCEHAGISALADVTTEVLEDFRRFRQISQVTGKSELQALRAFFAVCVRRKWLTTNPAKDVKGPRNLKPNEVVPYTLQEESLILAACGQIGGGKYNRSGAGYEQLRARAMIMLLRHTALRISDVCTIRRDAFAWDQEKNTWRRKKAVSRSFSPFQQI
jgi:site-specific recombinase XerD